MASDLAAPTDATGQCASLTLREADGQGEEVETFSDFISTPEAQRLHPHDLAIPPEGPDTPPPATTSPAWFKQYRTAATTVGTVPHF
jgi:hypothetical protein